VPPVDTVRCLFGSDFGEGSNRRPVDMLPPVHLLDAIIRWMILPGPNFRDGTTRLQQWLLSHLVRGIAFDIWDLMLCELEDTIYESFSAKRHMNYAHWISFLIYMGVELCRQPVFRSRAPLPSSTLPTTSHSLSTQS
jgi:hypothetical protein